MSNIWKNKFLFWNLIALVFIKTVFSYSGLQFASLIDGLTAFPKEEIIAQTNMLRQSLGFSILKENTALDIAAAQKLQDMVQNQYFAHVSPAGVSPWHWVEVNQYKYYYAGENLAIGFLTAKDTVNAWANSPSHRANLLNSNYKEIGIAMAPAKIQNSQGFLVVQLFGTPKPMVVPIATQPKPIAQIIISPSPMVQSVARENIEQPIVSQVNGISPQLSKTANTLNAAFIFYTLIVFLVFLVILAFHGLRKGLVVKTMASFAILILAIVIPVLQITRIALII